jgi:hypothetical protein
VTDSTRDAVVAGATVFTFVVVLFALLLSLFTLSR